MSAVVVCVMPRAANSFSAARMMSRRVASFCSFRVLRCAIFDEYILTELVLCQCPRGDLGGGRPQFSSAIRLWTAVAGRSTGRSRQLGALVVVNTLKSGTRCDR